MEVETLKSTGETRKKASSSRIIQEPKPIAKRSSGSTSKSRATSPRTSAIATVPSKGSSTSNRRPAHLRARRTEADVAGLIILGGVIFGVLSLFSVLGGVGTSFDHLFAAAFGYGRVLFYAYIGYYGLVLVLDIRPSLKRRYLSSGALTIVALLAFSSFLIFELLHPHRNPSLAERGGLIGWYTFRGIAALVSPGGAGILIFVVVVFSLLDLFGHSPIAIVRRYRYRIARHFNDGSDAREIQGAPLSLDEPHTSSPPLVHKPTRSRSRSRMPSVPVYDYAEDSLSNEAYLGADRGSKDLGNPESKVINIPVQPLEAVAEGSDSQELDEELLLGGSNADAFDSSPADEDLDSQDGVAQDFDEKADERVVAWKLPPGNILRRSAVRALDKDELWKRGRILCDALATHKVETSLVGMTVGPTVTRYELELGAGVKVARVTSLNKDIAYAMAAADVRILAPIPGRSAIGVEVPNERRVIVALGDVLGAPEAAANLHPLAVAIGRDISGKATLANLAEMPHVLIAGSTGSGKSSCLNSILTSILMRSTPDEVRMILIDPKRVELGQYNGVPHLLTPVVTNPKKAANALAWAVKEMEQRYDLLSELGARDIVGYNQIVENLQREASEEDKADLPFVDAANETSSEIELGPSPLFDSIKEKSYRHLPYIVVVVDELNDLMMVAARDVEESICRIAQMARAVGIHLVIATQRPSVDVITGLIKANIPSRMAFSVSSLADSRVILDQPGAERLIGKGDMLMLGASTSHPQRLQAPWVAEEEIRKVVASWIRQGRTSFVGDFEVVETTSDSSDSKEDEDELFMAALELVVSSQLGSTSMLQRKLRVGFSRAGRLMDLLERRGIVGPLEGSKPRVVLMGKEEFESYKDQRLIG